MTIGERIRDRRKELGLSQKELAEKMGFKTPSSICKAETIKNNPTMDSVREFAKALNTTPEYLLGWKEADTAKKESAELAAMVTVNRDLQHVVRTYLKLSDKDRQAVSALMDSLSD